MKNLLRLLVPVFCLILPVIAMLGIDAINEDLVDWVEFVESLQLTPVFVIPLIPAVLIFGFSDKSLNEWRAFILVAAISAYAWGYVLLTFLDG